MQEVFEYAVIRVVPRVEREEFLNVGVILYAKKPKFLEALYKVDRERLRMLSDTLDLDEVESHLLAMERICKGGSEAGQIGQLDMPSRFRWLTATRSTVVQTSKVHPGFCSDPAVALQRLFAQMVL